MDISYYQMNLSPTYRGYMGGGIRLRPRDFLKLGQLYLDGGVCELLLEESRQADPGRFPEDATDQVDSRRAVDLRLARLPNHRQVEGIPLPRQP